MKFLISLSATLLVSTAVTALPANHPTSSLNKVVDAKHMTGQAVAASYDKMKDSDLQNLQPAAGLEMKDDNQPSLLQKKIDYMKR